MMNFQFQNNFLGYFKFYYSVLGKKVFFNLGLCILVSFLDGMGLAMFMPLLQAVGGGSANESQDSMGKLRYITDALHSVGVDLTVNSVLAMLAFLFILKGALKYVQLSYQRNMRYLFMKKVRYKLVNDLKGLSYQGFLKFDAGKIQNTLIAEVGRLFQTMNFYFNAAQTAVMLLTYMVLAILANYQFAILVAIGAGITNLFYRKIYIATKKASRELSKTGNDFNGLLMQAVHHFKYLKATNYFNRFDSKLKNVIDLTEKINRKMGTYSAITTSLKEPMIISVVVLVIYLQISLMGANLTSIMLSLLLFYRALGFLVVVQNHWQNFIHNIGAIHSVTDFTQEMEMTQEENKGKQYKTFNREIVLKNVEFSYGENKTINNINITIPKNKTIAFVGESGSGKTTLANMITGLIKPDVGMLMVDGDSLNNYNINSYRNTIGYISQEPVIFNDNIYNNITFWADPTAENVKRFNEVIELSSLTSFVNSLPEKEQTSMGDHGILVSGGQKQRISIARELFKKAEILIMDEATSALDSETEKMIQENLEKLRGSYTMIIIAHRLSTIKDADIIYLLEGGKVTASGDFNNIIDQSVRFKRMVALQEF